MPNIRPTRTLSVLAIMCLLVLALAPAALAQAPDGITTGQPETAGEDVGTANADVGQALADQYHGWAEDYAKLVQEWTDCVRAIASSNGENEDGDAVNPLDALEDDEALEELDFDACDEISGMLDVNESPGLKLTGESVNFDDVSIE